MSVVHLGRRQSSLITSFPLRKNRLRQADQFTTAARGFYQSTSDDKRRDINKFAEYYVLEFYQKLKDWKIDNYVRNLNCIFRHISFFMSQDELSEFQREMKILASRARHTHIEHVFNLIHAYTEADSVVRQSLNRDDGGKILEATYIAEQANNTFVEWATQGSIKSLNDLSNIQRTRIHIYSKRSSNDTELEIDLYRDIYGDM